MQNNIGELLDSLGFKVDLEEGELVNGVVVLLETVDKDGETNLQILESDTTNWIKQIGMLQASLTAVLSEFGQRHDHDH